MLSKAVNFIRSLFSRKPVRLVVVRRYQDANGSYVGELYMDTERGCEMIGVSLDTCELDIGTLTPPRIDTANDFLADMPKATIRVGSLDPEDNDAVRRMVARLPRRRLSMDIRNRFVTDLRPAGPLAFNLQTKTPGQIIEEFGGQENTL